jgi:hypothetical protein
MGRCTDGFMIEAKEKHYKRRSICAKKGCTKCPVGEMFVPNECEYMIFHLLAPKDDLGGVIENRPRRSGKTVELMQIAQQHAEAGTKVVVVVPSRAHGENIRRSYDCDGIRFIPLSDTQKLIGDRTSLVLSDEIRNSDGDSLDYSKRVGTFLGGLVTD